MQAARGDNEGERPMWAEKGGLDFEGRARWDAWTERKGMKPPRAKMLFVQASPAVDAADLDIGSCLSLKILRALSGWHGSVPCLAASHGHITVLCLVVQNYYEFTPRALYTDTR